MTTIAYRDGFMAADSLITGGTIRVGATTKIGRLPQGGLYGCSGWIALLEVVVPWLEKGAPLADRPKLPDDADFHMLVAWPSGIVTDVDKRLQRIDLDGEFFASGSGYEIALGAMAMGATARQAVEIASRFDIYTGGRISTLSL